MTGAPPASRPPRPGRRAVLLGAGGLAAGAVGAGAALAIAAPAGGRGTAPAGPPDAYPSPGEDLMREHGVLKRVLLVYRELISRAQEGGPLPAKQLHDAALIIHDYIEGFHEGLEEGYVFPRLRRAGQLTGTVTTLLVQHARGRELTQFILSSATAKGVASPAGRARVARAMSAFDRMYEPHEAREDTVIFPAFREIVPAAELADLAQQFAELESQQFGSHGFSFMVNRVAAIERSLGIYDLSKFTPGGLITTTGSSRRPGGSHHGGDLDLPGVAEIERQRHGLAVGQHGRVNQHQVMAERAEGQGAVRGDRKPALDGLGLARARVAGEHDPPRGRAVGGNQHVGVISEVADGEEAGRRPGCRH